MTAFDEFRARRDGAPAERVPRKKRGPKLSPAEESRRAPMVEQLYYIQHISRPVGNSALWWRVDGHGYTCDLNEAWRVSAAKASSICSSRPAEDIPRLAVVMDGLAQRHVDVQALSRVKAIPPEGK